MAFSSKFHETANSLKKGSWAVFYLGVFFNMVIRKKDGIKKKNEKNYFSPSNKFYLLPHPTLPTLLTDSVFFY